MASPLPSPYKRPAVPPTPHKRSRPAKTRHTHTFAHAHASADPLPHSHTHTHTHTHTCSFVPSTPRLSENCRRASTENVIGRAGASGDSVRNELPAADRPNAVRVVVGASESGD